jgi:hypothetical protein
MNSIFEKKWFKWVAVGGSFFIVFSVLLGFLVDHYLKQRAVEARIEAQRVAEREYEDKFRSSMTRIYQNLKLSHFLAAYKNLEYLPEPKRSDPLLVEEYLEVLTRVGNGLIQNRLLREAENVFVTIRTFSGQISSATEALGKIESKRKIDNAKFFFSQGEKLLDQKRYREASLEFDKSRMELRSVQIMKYDDVSEQLSKLRPKLADARFHFLTEEAEVFIQEGAKFLKLRNFKKAEESLSAAAIKIGKAAYINSELPELAELRNRVADLDAELAYQLPNEVPIWNAYSKSDAEQREHYFRLLGYELGSSANENHQIKINLEYSMTPADPFFVVRYRIHFFNGKDFFNGHFLMGESKLNSDQVRSVTYMQEIPENFRGAQIKRIDVRVYDQNHQIVSRVTRAFRRVS